jgi:hypothetical protein
LVHSLVSVVAGSVTTVCVEHALLTVWFGLAVALVIESKIESFAVIWLLKSKFSCPAPKVPSQLAARA